VTPTTKGYKGLNGDIILWNPVLENAFEVSSMGIRVDKDSLLEQLEITGTTERRKLLFHKRLINNELPLIHWRRDRAVKDLHVLPAESPHR